MARGVERIRPTDMRNEVRKLIISGGWRNSYGVRPRPLFRNIAFFNPPVADVTLFAELVRERRRRRRLGEHHFSALRVQRLVPRPTLARGDLPFGGDAAREGLHLRGHVGAELVGGRVECEANANG